MLCLSSLSQRPAAWRIRCYKHMACDTSVWNQASRRTCSPTARLRRRSSSVTAIWDQQNSSLASRFSSWPATGPDRHGQQQEERVNDHMEDEGCMYGYSEVIALVVRERAGCRQVRVAHAPVAQASMPAVGTMQRFGCTHYLERGTLQASRGKGRLMLRAQLCASPELWAMNQLEPANGAQRPRSRCSKIEQAAGSTGRRTNATPQQPGRVQQGAPVLNPKVLGAVLGLVQLV